MSDVKWMFLLLFTVSTAATSPEIEVSYNMRHLQLPKGTKPGTIIYRLKGYDADNDVLTFAVRGTGASELLHVQSLSPTEANVILNSSPTRNRYEYTIFISDGSETSLSPSTIVFTEASNVPSPFLEYEPVITLAENTTLNEVIGYVIAKEKEISNLPVSFEIQGSEIFAIKYMFGPRGSSKAEISIVGDLDYEKTDFVRFKILALNAWTNSTVDTRNVATVDIVIIVEDVQDVPPIFIDLPPVITIAESSKPGEGLAAIKAVDGDATNQNNITYSLEPDSPLTSFFTINSTTGKIELLKTLDELRSQYGDCSTLLFLGVKAKESTTLSSSSEATTEIALFLTNPSKQTNPATDMTTTSDASGFPNQCIPVAPSHSASNESGQSAGYGINHAPRFTNQIYTGVIEENSFLQTSVQWTGASVPQVIDNDEGNNATFELYLEGGNQTFQVIPSSGTKTVDFRLFVRIPANLDYDNREIKYIDMEIVARETRSTERYSSRAKIKVSILDSNDNIPQFTKNIFEAQIPEDAHPGTFVAKIQATDSDTGDYGRIRYTTINGPIAQLLDLNPETGEVTLKSSSGLDRENVPEYTLTIEARDNVGRGNRNVTRLVLRLLDLNDNKPAFTRPRYDVILNSELSGFDRRIFISARDPDTVETSSNMTYRILSGPHSDRFNIDPTTGELTLIRPFASDGQSTTTSVVLRVQADDGGQQSTVEVQVHKQDYLNRTIYFVIPRPVDDIKTRKGDIARSFSTLIGSKVLIYSLEPFEGDKKKTLAKAWVSFPQKSTVNIEDMQLAVSNIYGRQYSQEEEIRETMVKKKDYDIIFWLFIALVILVFLILLICCCCWRWCCIYSKGTCYCTEDEENKQRPYSSGRIQPAQRGAIITETGSKEESWRQKETFEKKGWKEDSVKTGYVSSQKEVDYEHKTNKEMNNVTNSDVTQSSKHETNTETEVNVAETLSSKQSDEHAHKETKQITETRSKDKHGSSQYSNTFNQNAHPLRDSLVPTVQDNASQLLGFSRYHNTGSAYPNKRNLTSGQSGLRGDLTLPENKNKTPIISHVQQEKTSTVDYEEYWANKYGKKQESEIQTVKADENLINSIQAESHEDVACSPNEEGDGCKGQKEDVISSLPKGERDKTDNNGSHLENVETENNMERVVIIDSKESNTDSLNESTVDRISSSQVEDGNSLSSEHLENLPKDQSYYEKDNSIYETQEEPKTYINNNTPTEKDLTSSNDQSSDSGLSEASFSATNSRAATNSKSKSTISNGQNIADDSKAEEAKKKKTEENASVASRTDNGFGSNRSSAGGTDVQIVDKPLKVKKVPRYMEWYSKEKDENSVKKKIN